MLTGLERLKQARLRKDHAGNGESERNLLDARSQSRRCPSGKVQIRFLKKSDSYLTSDLQECFFGRGQQIDRCRQLLEELGGQLAQTDALEPVHHQVQVGPDLDTARPLVEPHHRTWREWG